MHFDLRKAQGDRQAALNEIAAHDIPLSQSL